MSSRHVTRLAGLLMATSLFLPVTAQAVPIDLGRASDFTLLATSGVAAGGTVNIGPQSVITGGVGGQQSVILGPEVTIDGAVSTPALISGAGVTTGPANGAFDGGARDDVRNASQAAAALSSVALGDVSGSRTLVAHGRSVFSIDNLTLGSGEFLTLDGLVGDELVLNVSGSFSFAENSGIRLGRDLLASNLLVNVLGLGAVNLNQGSFAGTLLAADRTLLIGAGALFEEVRFLTNNVIAGPQIRITGISGNAIVGNNEPLAVSEPRVVALFFLGFIALFLIGRRRQAIPYAS